MAIWLAETDQAIYVYSTMDEAKRFADTLEHAAGPLKYSPRQCFGGSIPEWDLSIHANGRAIIDRRNHNG